MSTTTHPGQTLVGMTIAALLKAADLQYTIPPFSDFEPAVGLVHEAETEEGLSFFFEVLMIRPCPPDWVEPLVNAVVRLTCRFCLGRAEGELYWKLTGFLGSSNFPGVEQILMDFYYQCMNVRDIDLRVGRFAADLLRARGWKVPEVPKGP